MKNRVVWVLCLVFAFGLLSFGCAKDNHWGQKLDQDEKWWKKEGNSWDRKDNIFMAIGYSNPDWTDKFDSRKSADTNARAEVSSFMQSLVKTYMEEVRSHGYSVSENAIEASSKETLLGSAVVSRHYDKKKKQYLSLIKIDLNYFFGQIYDKFRAEESAKIRSAKSTANLDEKITAASESAINDLKKIEAPVVEKAATEVKQ